MHTLKSISPSNYKVLDEVEVSSGNEIKHKVSLARHAQRDWALMPLGERVRILNDVVKEIATHKRVATLCESCEMGMPIREALVDFDGALDFARWYLKHAEEYLSPKTTHETDTEIHQVFREPRGVVAAIAPWNYPWLIPIWIMFQSLIAGNTVVFKHSEETPLCGQWLETIMTQNLPPHVFSEVYGGGDVGARLVTQNVDMISFTGSSATGRLLYKNAGKKFIPAVMELGGSAPGIVFEDADIDAAVASICEFRLSNAGQYCDGLKRLLVHRNIYADVAEKLFLAFDERNYKIGSAENLDTELGPLVSKRQLNLLVEQVADARKKGALVTVGGHTLEHKLGGAFHQATLLHGVTSSMKVWKEEVFGPVLPVVQFETEEEAISLANDTKYGLGGYIYTADLERAMRIACQIKSGMVSINGTNYTCPWNPFGGYKASGMGREHGEWGFHEVTQPKVIAMPK